ncbi:hypothetical protein HDV05_003255, partial [Chytridiales sp. JEL 0842]
TVIASQPSKPPPDSAYIPLTQLSSQTGIDFTAYLTALEFQTPPTQTSVYLYGTPEIWIPVLTSLSTFDRPSLGAFVLWRLAAAHFSKLSKEYYNIWGTQIAPHSVFSYVEPSGEGAGDRTVWQSSCVNELGANLNYLAGSVYVKYAFNSTQKVEATKLIDTLFEAFAVNIEALDWMDASTKEAAQKKLKEMVKIVGVPDWVEDPQKVAAYYKHLTFSPTTYFENAVSTQAFFETAPSVHQSSLPTLDRQGLYFGIPWALNAFHLTDFVQIQINPGILQRPLFSALNPSVMNWGSLGAVVGHE